MGRLSFLAGMLAGGGLMYVLDRSLLQREPPAPEAFLHERGPAGDAGQIAQDWSPNYLNRPQDARGGQAEPHRVADI